ncbi:MAG TPA: hypothetical protein VKA67_04320, partial [Verrucomicrobiae bacterium]|nr:hypothetical protein [Verrucomicrobiae bacterium]
SRIAKAENEDEYRAAVAEMLAGREDATLPEMGWPWPWNDSNTTDYAYAFRDGKVEAITEDSEWPDMSARSRVTMGKRSGIMVVCAFKRPGSNATAKAAARAGKN